ncbi:MAG: hypothetical protein ACLGSA_13910 [Acidobacteriota bacterium]
MHSQHHVPAPAHPELTRRIASSLGIGERNINEVDFDDLFVSETVVKTMHDLASTLMKQDASRKNDLDRDTTSGPSITAFWIEESLELVLCAAAGDGLHLVRVPGEHWTIKPRTVH